MIALISLLVLSLPCPADPGDVGSRLGAGNISGRSAEQNYAVLKQTGLSMARLPFHTGAYWDKKAKAPRPEAAEKAVLEAHHHRVRPVILFEYYTRTDGDIGQYDFKAIGRAFAERFRPNSPWFLERGIKDWGVEYYTAINEPTWGYHNPRILEGDLFGKTLEDLADGVHGVDPSLKVSPGGFIEGNLKRMEDHPLYAIGHLYNAGKLDAIDIHRYWDIQYIPMKGTFTWSLQSQFDEVKKRAGITADIGFQTTEFNFKKREISEDEAAKGLLTAMWDAVGVVGDQGQPVTRFAMPWGVFHLTEKDQNYGMLESLDPWKPTARGKVVKLVAALSKGKRFVGVDPRNKGLYVLEGGGEKLWVWQNRKAWSSVCGSTLTIDGIPAKATVLEIYGWDGKRQSIPVEGPSTKLTLPEGETSMIVAR